MFAKVVQFVDQHEWQIVMVVGAFLALCRAIPAETWQRLERSWPRVANTARALRALFPDVVKFLRVLVYVFTGRVWPGIFGAAATVIAEVPPPSPNPTPTPAPPRPPTMPFPVLLALAAFAFAGCPAERRNDNCQTGATRCVVTDAGTFSQTCLMGEGTAAHWVSVAQRSCEQRGGVCCFTSSEVSSRRFYACTTPDRCLPEPSNQTIAPADAGDGGAP